MAIGYEKRNKRLHNTKSIFQFGLNFFIEKKNKTTDPAPRQSSSMKIIEGIEKFILAKRPMAKPANNSLPTKTKEGNPMSSLASNGASKTCLKDATRKEKKTSKEAERIHQRWRGDETNTIATIQIISQLIKEKIILRINPLPKIFGESSELEAISLTTILCMPTSATTEANSAIANAKV